MPTELQMSKSFYNLFEILVVYKIYTLEIKYFAIIKISFEIS